MVSFLIVLYSFAVEYRIILPRGNWRWRGPNVIEHYAAFKQRLICFTVKRKGGHEYSVIEKALGFEQTEGRDQCKDTFMQFCTIRPRRAKCFVFKKRKQSLLSFREYGLFFFRKIMIKRKQCNRVEPEANNAYKTDLHTINDLIESML